MKHCRLPTGMVLWHQRIIIENPLCLQCRMASEDILHATRDCPKARAMWTALLKDSLAHQFLQATSLDAWLELNLSTPMERLTSYRYWSYVFHQTIQDLWTHRNAGIHRQKSWPSPYVFVRMVLLKVWDTLHSWYTNDPS